MQTGAVNNALKPFDAGITVTGMLIGSQRLFDFAHRNDSIVLHPSHYTHGESLLAQLPNLVTVNTALEVDLSGQSNAEQTGDDYVGGVGGQGAQAPVCPERRWLPDSASPGGCAGSRGR